MMKADNSLAGPPHAVEGPLIAALRRVRGLEDLPSDGLKLVKWMFGGRELDV
jgi:hypothetical protein